MSDGALDHDPPAGQDLGPELDPDDVNDPPKKGPHEDVVGGPGHIGGVGGGSSSTPACLAPTSSSDAGSSSGPVLVAPGTHSCLAGAIPANASSSQDPWAEPVGVPRGVAEWLGPVPEKVTDALGCPWSSRSTETVREMQERLRRHDPWQEDRMERAGILAHDDEIYEIDLEIQADGFPTCLMAVFPSITLEHALVHAGIDNDRAWSCNGRMVTLDTQVGQLAVLGRARVQGNFRMNGGGPGEDASLVPVDMTNQTSAGNSNDSFAMQVIIGALFQDNLKITESLARAYDRVQVTHDDTANSWCSSTNMLSAGRASRR